MGSDEIIESNDNPFFKTPSFELPILLGKGIITKIFGMEKIKEMPEVIHIFVKQKIGDRMEKKADFTQMLCRIHLQSKVKRSLLDCLGRVFENLNVLDENGNDMVINRECYNFLY